MAMVIDPAAEIVEIIEGAHHTTRRGSPRICHARDGLMFYLRRAFGDDADATWWIFSRPELQVGENRLVPDIAGWRRDRVPQWPDVSSTAVPPDFVCEVTHLAKRKLPAYARHGVSWAWVVDPIEQLIEVSRLKDGFWLNVATHTGDAVARMQPFDTLDIPLSRLWLTAPPAA